MARGASRRPGRPLLVAGLLSVWLGVAVALWWPQSEEPAQPRPAAAVVPAPLPAPPVAAAPAAIPEPPDPAALPPLRVPAGATGQDPLAAALKAARELPQPPPPPAIATAKTLEQAFAALQAAQADTAVPAGTSPFAAR
ncbi:hypothetical protein [Ramlibacter sp.]|uniref:hypothetical protein n=1 Tax=Ramlibacter sp. TaxID=1917967 RepID=UPI002B805130|nr:hypothetical protein [Ramlibacter sp.]HWI83032.1 hypothetical protein [Ramlibacter sp.]